MASNVIDRLRLRSLFEGPQFGGQINREPLFETPEITIPTGAPVTKVPKSPFMEEYRNILLNAPRREDYQTGKLGKVLALAAGTLSGATQGADKGIALGRDLLERPYNRAMEDYGIKAGRFKELSDLEHRADIEGRKLEIDTRKLALDEFKAISGLALDDARAKELLDRINTRGRSLQKNELTGELEVVDIKTGTKQSLGKFAETPEEKRTREHKFFLERYGTEQAGRKEIEGIRFRNDKALAKIKKELENRDVSATQDNAAFQGAMEEILTEYPDMKAHLFVPDDEGKLVLKKDYNKDVHSMFIRAVKERKAIKLGGKSTGLSEDVVVPNSATTPSSSRDLKVTAPPEVTPTVESPGLREAAIKAILETYPNNPEYAQDEENIQDAMSQLKEQTNNSVMPWGPISYPPTDGGIFRNFGTVTPNEMPNNPPYFSNLFGPSKSRTQKEIEFRGGKR